MTTPTAVASHTRQRAGAAHALVHVVTVTYNSASTLPDFLAGLAHSSALIAGVTVVDNGSPDETLALLRRAAPELPFALEVVEHHNAGFAGGYAAARASAVLRGHPVLCVNPDVVLAPGTVEALLDVVNSFPSSGVVTAPLVELDGTPDSASRRRLPTLGASAVYSVLGRLTPRSVRYNDLPQEAPSLLTEGGRSVTRLEATTGALMLVHPDFRGLDDGVFDTDYWMYGEDLQLCADARAAGRSVLMAEVEPSVHVKGVSSGRPRSHRSNRAFHDAMLRYARKNLVRQPVAVLLVGAGVLGHFALSEASALPTRVRRRLMR